MSERAVNPFTDEERRTLAAIADLVIPPSEEYGVPGAGDASIVEGILADAARSPARLSAALAAVDRMAREAHGVAFADLEAAQREGIVEAFQEEQPARADAVASLAVQAYYRDDRVMRALGMELRPPHPLGFQVAQGDWSLLEPVRQRAEMYRKAK